MRACVNRRSLVGQDGNVPGLFVGGCHATVLLTWNTANFPALIMAANTAGCYWSGAVLDLADCFAIKSL